jgi:hypothetical protein
VSCAWVPGQCNAQGQCSPGATQTISCNTCSGMDTQTCSDTCVWVSGGCSPPCPTCGCGCGCGICGICGFCACGKC